MNRTRILVVVGVAIAVIAAVAWQRHQSSPREQPLVVRAKGVSPNDRLRRELFAELQPVALENCELTRFGEANDGGYVLCGNLLGSIRAGYSYGISGYDGWGCQLSSQLKVPVHEYDCFDLHEPPCPNGRTIFHAECVAGKASHDDAGRPFETLAHQIATNGDAGRHLVVKMDVEGAEWETFLATPDQVLEQIDQLAVEFHGSNRLRYAQAIAKLKRIFYVANLHFNNYSCGPGSEPFPAWAYEVLLVNKRLAVPDPSGRPADLRGVNAPNNPALEDCQMPQPEMPAPKPSSSTRP